MNIERVIYIAAPLRAKGDNPFLPHPMRRNHEYAYSLACICWQAGWAAISPHGNTDRMDGLEGVPSEAFVNGDLAIIRRLIPGRDAVLFGKGWEDSEGCRQEHEAAAEWKLAILYASNFTNTKQLQTYLRVWRATNDQTEAAKDAGLIDERIGA
ncbi:MAG: DUF4406 domain-containing protein [Phycisphaerae bacterium]|nr:DUF4406 domain-containing protein [Phycisphaerae bacterium]